MIAGAGMRVAAVLVLASTLAGCSAYVAEKARDEIPVLVRVTHVSAGDRPLVTMVVIFETGQLRYLEVGGEPRWARLSPAELAAVREAVLDPRFSAALEALNLGPKCCGYEWLAVERVLASGTLERVKTAPTITLAGKQIDPQLRRVLKLIGDACAEHLAREFPRSSALESTP